MINGAKDRVGKGNLETDYQELESYQQLDPRDNWEELAGIVLTNEGDIGFQEFYSSNTADVIRLIEDLDLPYKLNNDDPREYLLSHHRIRNKEEMPEVGSKVSDEELERMLEGDDFQSFRDYLNEKTPQFRVYANSKARRDFDKVKKSDRGKLLDLPSLSATKLAIATGLKCCAQQEKDYAFTDISRYPFYTKLAGLALQKSAGSVAPDDLREVAEELAQDERQVTNLLTEIEDYDGLEFRYGFTPGVHDNQICDNAREKARSIEKTLRESDLDLLHEVASQNYYHDALRVKEAISLMADDFSQEDWQEFDPTHDPEQIAEKVFGD